MSILFVDVNVILKTCICEKVKSNNKYDCCEDVKCVVVYVLMYMNEPQANDGLHYVWRLCIVLRMKNVMNTRIQFPDLDWITSYSIDIVTSTITVVDYLS